MSAEYEYESKYTIYLGDYTFTIRPEEREGFQKRLQDDPSLESTLSSNVNDELWASLEYAIRMQSNSIIKCFGIPESGKSTILQIVGYHLFQMILAKKRPILEMTFDYPETIHKIQQHFKNRKAGEILILLQDEQNNLSGSESRSYQTQIDNLLKTFRAAQVFVLLASPDDIELSVCNMKIEAIAKDLKKRVNWAIAYVPQRKKRKIEFVPSGTLLMDYTREIEEFYKEFGYENKKMEYIEKIIANRGLQTVRIPDSVLEDGIEKILTEAKKYKLKTKEQVKGLANVLGIGTTNTTKTIAELAGLRWDAIMEGQKQKEVLRQIEAEKQKQKEEEKRISQLVLTVAKELYAAFHFDDMKAASRMVTGWIIEHYPEDWQHLVKHKKYYWSLAEYWQNKQSLKNTPEVEPQELVSISSDRKLLRKAFYDAVHLRYSDMLLCERASWFFIWSEDCEKDTWSIARQARENQIRPSTMNNYWRKHKSQQYEIANNNKIWGDAGELYLKYRLLQIWQKGQKELWINPELAIELPCAAELRSKGGKTDIYDLEVVIGDSKAAVNIKFSYLDNQSFSMSPESAHDHPYLFIIDKNTLKETLLPSEKGKPHLSVHSGVQSQSVEDFVRSLL